MNVLCPLHDRLCRDVRRQRGGIWQHSRDVRLPYCARLEPLDSSGCVQVTRWQPNGVLIGSLPIRKPWQPASRHLRIRVSLQYRDSAKADADIFDETPYCNSR
jgi:hypothetical protein